jgi:hypothetical protein
MAEAAEGIEDAVEGAAVAGLVAFEEGEGAGIVGEGAEGEGGAGALADGIEIALDLGLEFYHFDVEEGGFGGPDALEAPADSLRRSQSDPVFRFAWVTPHKSACRRRFRPDQGRSPSEAARLRREHGHAVAAEDI